MTETDSTATAFTTIAAYTSPDRWFLGAGAMVASIIWFVSLGYRARKLGPLFARPIAWRVLDSVIAAEMFCLALGLLLTG